MSLVYVRMGAVGASLALVGCNNEVSNPVDFGETGMMSTGTSTSTTTGPDDTTGSTSGAESTETTAVDGSTTSEDSTTTGFVPGVCGNGELEDGEFCDDGNMVNNDGCSNDCGTPGLVVWQTFFAGTAGFDDHAYGVATDSEGNVLVVGTTTTINEEYDIRIAKYDPAGAQLWAVTLDGGLLLDDFAFDVAVDADDNVLVTGSTFVSGQGFDAWIAKYNFNGLLVWQQTHHGPVASKDEGHSIVVDADGNAIVGGYEYVSGQGRNAWIAKYDPDGNQLWSISVDGVSNGTDEVASLELDPDGNIVAAGQTFVDGEETNVWVGKYDPGGAEIWVTSHNGAMGGEDFASGIGALPDGSMIVTGATQVAFNVSVNPIYDLWLGKIDTDGNLVWEDTLDGPLMGDDFGEEIAVDSLGNYVVVGALAVDETVPDTVYNGQPPQRHGWIRKFDPDDNELWTVEYGPKTRDTWAYGVAVDSGDNVFVAGQLRQQGMTNIDQVLMKITP